MLHLGESGEEKKKEKKMGNHVELPQSGGRKNATLSQYHGSFARFPFKTYTAIPLR